MVEVELAVATPAQSAGICGAWNFSRRLCAALLIVPAMFPPFDSRGERQRAGEEESPASSRPAPSDRLIGDCAQRGL